tara:strand:+ start:20 stop:508 length:489 start_codon:yes stop_codon:yes gene_type:complete
MVLSNTDLAICLELKALRRENKILKTCIKSTTNDISNREKLYEKLVYLARNNPNNTLQERIDFVKSEIGEDFFEDDVYEKEIEKLRSGNRDYTHGFNSGMLASTRLYENLLKYTPEVYENVLSNLQTPVEINHRNASTYFTDVVLQPLQQEGFLIHKRKLIG